MIKLYLYFIAITGLLVANQDASAKPLVGDISNHEITLHTSFSGTELMFFGARNEPGDIIVVVRGPKRKATVHKKEKSYGIWINSGKETFDSIPSFYALASSRPYEEIQKSIYFSALGVGYDAALNPFQEKKILYSMKPSSLNDAKKGSRGGEYQRALLRHLKTDNLYNQAAGKVEFIGETLFKITIPFPDTTPRGTYTAEMYLFSNGELVSTHTTPIEVYKIGFDAFIYELAHQQSFIYGIIAVIFALMGGWSAAAIFKRV